MKCRKYAMLMSATGFVCVMGSRASRADTIADWTFESSQPAGIGATIGPISPELGAGSASSVHAGAATVYSSPAGNGSAHSFSSNTWATNDYYQFAVATLGFQSVSFGFDQTRSTTGPAGFDVMFSTDGTNFLDLSGGYTVSSSGFSAGSHSNTLVLGPFSNSSLDNQSSVIFRIVDTAATGATTGTNRVDNVIVSGTALVPPNPRNLSWNGSTNTWLGNAAWNDTAGSATTWINANPDNATFGTTTTPNVTLGGPVTVGSIAFTGSNYTINGGGSTLTINGVAGTGITAAQSVNINSNVTLGSAQTWSIAPNTSLSYSGVITGVGALTKTGLGSLVFTSPSTAFTQSLNISAGSTTIKTADASNNINITGAISVGAATLNVDTSTSATATALALGNGSTVNIAGIAHSSNVTIQTGTIDSPVSVQLHVGATAADTLEITAAIRQSTGTATTGDAMQTINVTGPGRIIIDSGGVSAASVFGGNWNISNGVVQVGPIPKGSTGEPMNGLGFRNGSPASAVPVTLSSSGILLGADNAPNPAANSAPNTVGYFRNPLTLNNGGAFGSSVVDATYSGSIAFNNAGTDARILTFDPVLGGARNVGIIADGGMTWNGNVTIEPNTTTGGTVFIERSYSGSPSPVSVTSGATITVKSGAGLSLGGASAALSDGTHSVNIVNNSSAAGLTIAAGAQAVGTISGAGATTVADQGSLTADNIVQSSLTINGVGQVSLRPNGHNAAVIGSLTIGDNTLFAPGQLDLNDNDLIVPYTGSSPLSTVAALVRGGFNANGGGFWDGRGITSTSAHNDASHQTALGYGEAADVGITSLDGVPITGNAVIVKFTYYGDSSLDGKVDLGNDFNLFLTGFMAGTGNWETGDYNFDTVVNMADFTLFLDGYAANGGQLGVLENVIASSDELTISQKSALLSVVPEPSSLATIAAVSLLGLRRRRTRAIVQA